MYLRSLPALLVLRRGPDTPPPSPHSKTLIFNTNWKHRKAPHGSHIQALKPHLTHISILYELNQSTELVRAAVAERRTANCPAIARLASYSPRKWWSGVTWRDHHDHCHCHVLGQVGLALRTSFSGLFVRSQIDWFRRDKIGGWLTLAAGNCSLEQAK